MGKGGDEGASPKDNVRELFSQWGSSAGPYVDSSMGLLLVAILLFIVALADDFWAEAGEKVPGKPYTEMGLWHMCSSNLPDHPPFSKHNQVLEQIQHKPFSPWKSHSSERHNLRQHNSLDSQTLHLKFYNKKDPSLGLLFLAKIQDKDPDWLQCTWLSPGKVPAWYRATQAMIALGFASVILAFISQSLYACSNTFHQQKLLEIIFVVVSYFCVICTMIGLIVFAHFLEIEEEILDQGKLVTSWCFILAAVAAGIIFVAGSLGLLEVIFNPKYARFRGHSEEIEIGNSGVETREMDNPAATEA